jgi:hypothetical protein
VFLPFEWPLLLRDIVLGYLVAFLLLRVAAVFGRFCSPEAKSPHPQDWRAKR